MRRRIGVRVRVTASSHTVRRRIGVRVRVTASSPTVRRRIGVRVRVTASSHTLRRRMHFGARSSSLWRGGEKSKKPLVLSAAPLAVAVSAFRVEC